MYTPKDYDSFIKYVTDTTKSKVCKIVPKRVNDYMLDWSFDIESICGMTANSLKLKITAKSLGRSVQVIASRINIREISRLREDYYKECFERELENKVSEMILTLIKQIIQLGENDSNEKLCGYIPESL